MRRRRGLFALLALAALAAGLLRRVAFRPRERAELHYEDGSSLTIAGSPQVDRFAEHARSALAAR
jgi:hypothetical protein